jgi:hypothetical protein
MAVSTSGNPHDEPTRTQEASRKAAAGGLGNLEIVPQQPVPAEVEAPPDDKDLTGGAEECQNPVEMPTLEAKPGPTDPALQEAFDAFDGAKLPRPPLTKLKGVTPAEGLKALRALVEYLDSVGDPVANVVQVVLSELRGKSFETLEQTREFVATVQLILDRTGYAVVCPSCSEAGRLDTAPRATAPSGVYRVRHGTVTHGGSSMITALEFTRRESD